MRTDTIRPQRQVFTISERTLAEAKKKAEALLKKPEYQRIQMEDFSLYNPDIIAGDTKKVAETEARWALKGHNENIEGEVAEVMLMQMINTAQWFGNAKMVRTAKYDDYFNHIDAIAGLEREDDSDKKDFVGITLDATTSTSGLASKVQRIIQTVKSGNLGSIRYGKFGDFKGEMSNIPQAVLFIDRLSFKDTVERWALTQNPHMSDDDKRAFNTLASHRLQLELLCQIAYQMQQYAQIAPRQEQKDILKRMWQVAIERLKQRLAVVSKAAHIGGVPLIESPSVVAIRKAFE